LEARMGNNISSSETKLKNKLNNGSIQDLVATFDDAIFQYISETAQIAETAIGNLVNLAGYTAGPPTSEMYNADRAFFSVVQNGMHTIRQKSEEIEADIVKFYKDRFGQTKINVIIATCFSFAIIVIAAGLLAYIVSGVTVRNEQVLTLFARINPQDIRRLCEKCENFLKTRLSERMTDNEYTDAEDPKDSENNDNENEGNNEELQLLDGEEQEGDYDMQTEKPGLVDGSQKQSQKGINTSSNEDERGGTAVKPRGKNSHSDLIGGTNMTGGSLNNSEGLVLESSKKGGGKYQSEFITPMTTPGPPTDSTGKTRGHARQNGLTGRASKFSQVPQPSRQSTKQQSGMSTKKSMHQQALEKKEEEEENDLNDVRVSKLLNSKDSDRYKVIKNFIFISVFILMP
jgi:ribosomal protein L12E/L44/L45/RPP1/RPP2